MKKIIAISLMFAGMFVFAVDDPDYAYVDVPYTCVIDSENKVVTTTFANGSIRNFYYCSFVNSHMKVTDAMSQFGSKYDSIRGLMSSEGIAEKFYMENMTRWEQVVQAILYIGQAKQQEIEYATQQELMDAYEAGVISEQSYANQLAASHNRINTLESNYNAAFSGIYEQMTLSVSSLEQQLVNAKEQQAIDMQTLKNELAKQKAGEYNVAIDSTAVVQKNALDIAALQKTISSLKTELNKKNLPIIACGDVSNMIFTNNMNVISRWIGSHKSMGVFTPPVNPVTSNRYTIASQNIVDWMFDLGIVGYRSMAMLDDASDKGIVNKYGNANVRKFYETYGESNAKTNVVASFTAPTNWVDGVTIVYSNGVYHAFATNDVASSSGPFAFKGGQLRDCYYNVGGKTYSMSPRGAAAGQVLAIQLSASSSTGSYVTFETVNAMQSAQNDLTKYIIPLYKFDANGKVEADLRTSLNAVMMEY